jgi:hypothetical protein
MSLPSSRQLPDISAWQAQSVQLVAFPTVSPITIPQRWWEEVVGESPAEVHRKRQEQSEEKGNYRNSIFT